MKERIRTIGILVMLASFVWCLYDRQMYWPETTVNQWVALGTAIAGLATYLIFGGWKKI